MLDSAPPTAGKLRRINPPHGVADKPRYLAGAAEIYGWVCRRVFSRVGTVGKSLHSKGKKWI